MLQLKKLILPLPSDDNCKYTFILKKTNMPFSWAGKYTPAQKNDNSLTQPKNCKYPDLYK